MMNWKQSATELPEIGTRVIVCDCYDDFELALYDTPSPWDNPYFCFDSDNPKFTEQQILSWLEIPAPPDMGPTLQWIRKNPPLIL